MQKLILSFVLFTLSLSSFAQTIQSSGNIEERMYFVQEMSEALFQICFKPDGTYKGEVIFSQPELSIRETAIDCHAQIDALNQEMEEIDAIMALDPNVGCSQLSVSAEGDSLAAGVDEILGAQNSCPGRGSASDDNAALIQNIACSLGKVAVPFLSLTGVCRGGDCATNLFAGVAYSASDMLSLFGLCFMCPEEKPKKDAAAEERGASDEAAIAASFQDPQSVVSFNSDPLGWLSNAASSLFNSMKTSIMERFGCAQWEDPSRPYRSNCLAPMSWSCASPSQKTNMVCGTAGYVLGVVGMEVATAGAVGAAIGTAGLVARATASFAGRAARMYPRSAEAVGLMSRSFGRAMRLGTTAAVRLRNVWTALKETRSIRAITMVSQEISSRVAAGATRAAAWREAFRGQYFMYAGAEDLLTAPARAMIAAAKRFNQLSEQAFNLGYSATGAARLRAIKALEANSPLISDLQNGRYVDDKGNALTTPEAYFNFRHSKDANREFLRPIVSEDGRLRIVDTRAAGFRSEIRLDGLDAPTPAPVATTRAPTSSVSDEVIMESEPIVITASPESRARMAARRRDDLKDVLGRSVRLSDEQADRILSFRKPPEDGETLLQFNQRRENIIDELKRAGNLSDADALTQYNRLVQEGVVRERQLLTGSSNIPAPGVVDSFDNARDLDLTLRSYTRGDETVPGLISSIQRGEGVQGITNLDDFFRLRNVPPRDQRIIRSLWDETQLQRTAAMNRLIADDLARLRANGAQLSPIDCASINRVKSYSDAFAGQCHRVLLPRAARGEYCTCNATSSSMRKPGPWMLPCAQVGEYLTSRSQADFTALPAKDVNRCWKVDLPENTVCFHGGLGATFSGFGGQAQMACIDQRSLDNIREQNPADVVAGLNLPPNGADWRISNWSPISDNPEVLRITQIGRECFDQTSGALTCSPDTLDEIRRLIDGGNFSTADRNELELYHQYLRGDVQLDAATGYPFCMRGGTRVPALSPSDCLPAGQTLRLSSASPSPISRGPNQSAQEIVQANRAEFERVSNLSPQARTNEASQALGRDLTATQRTCIMNAHDVGLAQGRGYGTFTFEDLRAKRTTLTNCGFSAADARELMNRGLVGGFPPQMRLGQPVSAFGATQGNAALQRAENLSTRFRGPRAQGGGQGLTRLEYQRSMEEAGAAFENQARQTSNAILVRPHLENALSSYLRAGDSAAVMRVITLAKEKGMTEEQIMRLLGRTAATDGTSPMGPNATIALRSVRSQLEEQARLARTTATPEVPTPAPAATRTPAQQARDEQITRLITSNRPLQDESLLIDRANQYRLGESTPGFRNLPQNVQDLIRTLTPTQRADISSNLYYQSARTSMLDRSQPIDGMLFVGRGGHPNARQITEAFEQSFRGEGVVARKMIDDIVTARGADGLKEFIREAGEANYSRLFPDVPANQGAKTNLREWAEYIKTRYGTQLSPTEIQTLETFR